jgi:hypothetical protein
VTVGAGYFGQGDSFGYPDGGIVLRDFIQNRVRCKLWRALQRSF